MKTYSELVRRKPSDYNGCKDYSLASNHWLRMAAFSSDYELDPALFDEVLARGGIDLDTAEVFLSLYDGLDPCDIFYVAAHEIDDDDKFWLRSGLSTDDIDDMFPPFSDDEEKRACFVEEDLFGED